MAEHDHTDPLNVPTASEEAVARSAAGVVVSDAPVSEVDLIDSLDKDGLEQFARDNFGREIDKRKKIETLRAEVKLLLDGTTQREERAAVVAAAEAAKPRTPKRCRHVTLCDPDGKPFEFTWNPHYEGNPDLEVIEWE